MPRAGFTKGLVDELVPVSASTVMPGKSKVKDNRIVITMQNILFITIIWLTSMFLLGIMDTNNLFAHLLNGVGSEKVYPESTIVTIRMTCPPKISSWTARLANTLALCFLLWVSRHPDDYVIFIATSTYGLSAFEVVMATTLP